MIGGSALETIRLLQEELAAGNKDALALAMELEDQVALRTAELQEARAELQKIDADLLYFILELEDLVSKRTSEVTARSQELERRLEERSAQVAAASHHRGQFLADLAHELRGPLTAILGLSQSLRGAILAPRHRESAEQIHRAGELLLEAVTGVLEFARIEAGQVPVSRAQLDLNQLIRDLDWMFRLQAEARQVTLTVEAGSLPGCVQADEAMLRQILMSLVGNAIKSTGPGVVSIRAAATPGAAGSADLEVVAKDTGPGLPPDGTTGEPQPSPLPGPGLGLALSQQFARLMGGELTQSGGDGAVRRFRLRLPLQACAEAAPGPGSARGRSPRLPMGHEPVKVLVVDDREDNRLMVVKPLRRAGFLTQEAEDGPSALALLQSWQPQAVFLGLGLADLGGLEVLRRLRATGPGRSALAVAVATGAFQDNRQAALAAGADDFLGLPFRDEDLFEKLRTHLDITYDGPEPGPPRTCAGRPGSSGSKP